MIPAVTTIIDNVLRHTNLDSSALHRRYPGSADAIRRIVVASVEAGHSMAETAEAIGCSASTAARHYERWCEEHEHTWGMASA